MTRGKSGDVYTPTPVVEAVGAREIINFTAVILIQSSLT